MFGRKKERTVFRSRYQWGCPDVHVAHRFVRGDFTRTRGFGEGGLVLDTLWQYRPVKGRC